MFSFEIVPGSVAKDILDGSTAAIVDLVEDAYLRHDAGRTVNPDSYFLRFPDKPEARIIALPAYIGLARGDIAGIKWVASFPRNVADGLPRASAVLVLNDYATGYPVALLEAATISAVRTAASAAVAARALARHVTPDGTVAMIGAGVIARTILRYLVGTGYPVDRLVVHDLHAESAANLIRFARAELGLATCAAGGRAEAMAAQTVVTATTAVTPYISEPLRPGQVALNISLRDFVPDVVLGAQNVLDDVEHCLKAETSPHLAEQVTGDRAFVTGTLADVLTRRVRPSADRGVLFSPFGLGVLDIAVGHWLLSAARERGLTIDVPNFFGETRRW
jgi:N-[(2S)-2-amino-2-carboxyethyl]-L-glutamate dehydrogenase